MLLIVLKFMVCELFYIINYLITTAHSKNISYSCYATRFVIENKKI